MVSSSADDIIYPVGTAIFMNDIESYRLFKSVQEIVDRIKRVSFYLDQTQKRYPMPEAMPKDEFLTLTKLYLAFYLDIEDIQKDFKKVYDGYNKANK